MNPHQRAIAIMNAVEIIETTPGNFEMHKKSRRISTFKNGTVIIDGSAVEGVIEEYTALTCRIAEAK